MDAELRNMVMAFRVTELQTLLGQFNKNKNGRKNELQARALELVKVNNSVIAGKIRELYTSIQLSLNQPLPASAVLAHSNQQQQFVNSGRVFGPTTTTGISTDKVMYQGRPQYGNAYTGQMPGLQVINHNSRVPICPDVKLRDLPFYDIQAQLTRPTSLLSTSTSGRVHDANFTFFLTPSQAAEIASSKEFNNNIGFNENKVQYTTQVQMRFCALETGTPQDDLFPPSVNVKVNGRVVPLPHPIPSNRPGVEPKRPSRPLNVTNYVKVSPTVTNNVNVTWASDASGRDYVISITLVRRLVSQDLLNRLKAKGPRPSDYTKGMVKEMVRKDDADCIASSTFKVSVACPLGKCRMALPCRASTCKHLQCFDANLYLQMNEKKPVWSCPVCDKYTAFEDLAIDGYFQEVIAKLCSSDVNDIEVMKDGTWTPLQVKKEPDEPPAKRAKQAKMNDTICLDDDDVAVISDDDEDEEELNKSKIPSEAEKPKSDGPVDLIDLTCTSDEEEEEESKDEQNNVSYSSNAESDDEIIKPGSKRKKPFVFEESSSSSAHSPGSTSRTSTRTPTVPVAQPQPGSSPDCITLDSPTPSPEARQERNQENQTKPSETQPATAADAVSSTPPPPVSPTSNSYSDGLLGPSAMSFNSIPLFGASSLPAPSGLGLASGLPSGTDSPFAPSNPFSSTFDRNTWDNLGAASFPSTTDFSSLEYPSMDYFNQGSSAAFGGTGRTGGAGGFGSTGNRYF